MADTSCQECKADWELALVETASNLSKKKAAMGGGRDPLLLNGMCDQGAVRQNVNNAQMSGGSARSLTLLGMGKSTTPVLALPAPDGIVQTVGQQYPFCSVPCGATPFVCSDSRHGEETAFACAGTTALAAVWKQ